MWLRRWRLERIYSLCQVVSGWRVVAVTTYTSISLADIVSRNSSAVLRRVEVLSRVHNILWSIFKKLQLPEYFNLNPHFVTMAGWLLDALRGEKRKNSGEITVQAASKSWIHGSAAATSGRKVNDLPSHSQAFIVTLHTSYYLYLPHLTSN